MFYREYPSRWAPGNVLVCWGGQVGFSSLSCELCMHLSLVSGSGKSTLAMSILRFVGSLSVPHHLLCS